MEYRNFGDSGLKVSAIGFGCWPMGGTFYGQIDEGEEIAAVHRALDLGITCFDNAAGYGLGHSEAVLGRALGARREDVVVATKCGLVYDPQKREFDRDGSRSHVLKSIDESLSRLGTDYVDLYLIHQPDPATPVAETMGALEDLITAGKIRYAGVCNFLPDRLAKARETLRIITNQVGYHLFDRRIEREIIPFCKERRLGIMAYGSLAHGLLAGALAKNTTFDELDWRAGGNSFGLPLFKSDHFEKNLDAVEEFRVIARRAGRPLAQLASAWVLRDPVVTVSLIGFRRPAEVDEAVKAVGWRFTPFELNEIETISRRAFERLYADQDLNPAKGPPNPENPYPPNYQGPRVW